MNTALLDVSATVPEWKHCAPYLLAAIALHLLALAWPCGRAAGDLEMPPVNQIMVHLVDQASVPPTVQSPPSPPHSQPPAQRERPQKIQRTILAVPASTPSTPTAFVVPLALAAPHEPAPSSAESSVQAAPATYSPAKFNAAYLQNPAPTFPPLSRRLGEQGKVLLKVKVGVDGHPVAVDLEKSSNFERLDDAARLAVSHWRFVPAKRGDVPVEGLVIVPIVFRLDD